MKSYISEKTDVITKYFKDVNKYELLSSEEEILIAERITNGDESAINELINANLKFVVSVAKEYQGLGLPLADLINEGNVGLIKAAKRFDPTKGFKFISYAVHWIRQSIMQSLNDNSRMIRLPSNIINKILQINKQNKENIEEVYPTCVSLNNKIGEYSGFELSDMIEDENTDNLDVLEYETERLKKTLNKTLECLTNKERGIIECYFGLNTGTEPMTLEAIGDRYDLTKERIRQIKEKAIRCLRHNNIDLQNLINN
jgi:RNA polymerase primary sigma factor